MIGAGEEWDGARPTAIADAYVTIDGDIDYPLDILTDSEYAAEPNKTLQASMPKGFTTIRHTLTGGCMSCRCRTALTITLVHDEAFTALASVSTSLSFPPGYERALRYALAVDWRLNLEKTVSDCHRNGCRVDGPNQGAQHTTSICELRHDANGRRRVLVC